MFARAALRCRTPPTRQSSLVRKVVLQPRFLLPRLRSFNSTSQRPNIITTKQLNVSLNVQQPEPKDEDELPKFVPPPFCPGCGAPSQQTDTGLPGYYLSRPTKRQRFGPDNLKVKTQKKKREDEIWEQALQRIKTERETGKELKGIGPLLELESEDIKESAAEELNSVKPQIDGLKEITEAAEKLADLKSQTTTPICQRCHTMVHYHSAPPLPSYPTLDTLTNLLQSSPHKKNHIYHLIDAADLPMSLTPNLRSHLDASLPREITRGLTLSYVVTRSDLLMPTENQVRSLMTWIKKAIKNALPEGEKVESYNAEDKIHVVSARQGWGIGKIKLETRHREGGVWVVGAVNVGKSRLVREVWPESGKGRAGSLEEADELDLLPDVFEEAKPEGDGEGNVLSGTEIKESSESKKIRDRQSPSQVPPTVSDIPGTTAAPIRVMFKTVSSHGRKALGELVDLPGLERWVGFGEKGLLPFVREDRRKEFRMEKRINAMQRTIKPGQSMLIAGVILVTPKILPEDELVILAHPFISLPVHITSTRKALQHLSDPNPETRFGSLFQKALLQTESSAPKSTSLHDLTEEVPYTPNTIHVYPNSSNLPPHFASAGTYTLSDDVTAFRNPLLPSKDPNSLENLPYRILATDILLEGIGWVELVAQVRRKKEKFEGLKVQVEVFTPEGKGIGSRITMGADMIRKKGAQLAGAAKRPAGRPRRSMKGDKKRKKLEKRAAEGKGSS